MTKQQDIRVYKSLTKFEIIAGGGQIGHFHGALIFSLDAL